MEKQPLRGTPRAIALGEMIISQIRKQEKARPQRPGF
jgi:hypothetical protein